MTLSPATDGKPIYLIGMMGVGKSTVGALLAARLGRPFVDLDGRIEQEAGMTISELFATGGETPFREREAAALARTLDEGAQVVAVGGGAVLYHGNLDKMVRAGVVVCLSAPAEVLLQRIGEASTRPLLVDAVDRPGEIERLLFQRRPYYQRAHITVDTGALAPSQVATRIVGELEKWQ